MSALSKELATDPLARGYAGMTDQQVVDSLLAINRDAPAGAGALFNYFAKETAKDVAAEPSATSILGRLERIHEAGISVANASGSSSQVFGTDPAFSNLTPQRLDACRTVLRIAEQDRLGDLAQVMTEQKLINLLDLTVDAGVMKPMDVSAIVALSQNKQSRAEEIGAPRKLHASTIAAARA